MVCTKMENRLKKLENKEVDKDEVPVVTYMACALMHACFHRVAVKICKKGHFESNFSLI